MRRLAALTLGLLLGTVPRAWADRGYGVTVQRTSADGLAVGPGRVVTAAFRVAPRGDVERTWIEALELPPGWTAVTPTVRFPIEPGGVRLRFVAVQVPADAPAGAYRVRYVVTDERDPGVHDVGEVAVIVDAVGRADVALGSAPPIVVAGEAIEIPVHLSNGGNTALAASVEAVAEPGLTATVDRDAVDLAPRGAAELRLTVRTDPGEARPTERVVRVRLRAGEVQDEAVLVLKLVPRGDRVSLWRRFPLSLGAVGMIDSAGGWGVQGELRGAGALDRDGRWEADLLLRGPDTEEQGGTFGQRDELRGSVRGPWLSGQVGDQTYGLSWLTSPSRYGRGVGVQLAPGALRLGGHVVRERFTDDPSTEIGGRIGVALGERGTVGVNVLRRLGPDEATVVALAGDLQPLDGVDVAAELAVDPTPVGPAFAGRLAAVGRLPTGLGTGLGFTLRETYAAPGFRGHERDVHRSSASVAVPLSRRVAGAATYQRVERNLARDAAVGTAPVEHRAEATVTVRPTSTWSVGVGALGAAREEHLDPADRLADDGVWQEGALRLLASHGSAALSFALQGLVGLHRDHGTGALSVGEQVGAHLSYQPDARIAVRASATWGSDSDRPSSLYAVDTAVSTGATWQPVDGLLLDLDGRCALGGEAPVGQLETRARYTHGSGASVAARWRTELVRETVHHAAIVSVSVPVGVPIGRVGEVGGLEGRLFDADAPDRRGLGGVVVRAGAYATRTDADGRFSLPRLPAGAYALIVDPTTLGMDRIGTTSWPLRVEVVGGRTASVDVGTTTAAVLRGQVTTAAVAGSGAREGVVVGRGEAATARPLAGATVVLSSDDQRLVRVTDADGRFRADGVRAGAWRVEVAGGAAGHEARAADLVAVEPGAEARADVVLAPKVRAIRMLAVPDVVLSTDGPPVTSDLPAAAPVPLPGIPAPRFERAAAPAATAPRQVAWEAARWRARAGIGPAGDFLGGRFGLSVADAEGRLACEVEGEWRDDGATLPEPCPGCAWAAHTEVVAVSTRGGSCHDLDRGALALGSGTFAWTASWRHDGRDLRDVLLRWGGDAWVPIAVGVDPVDVEASGPSALPGPR